MALAEDDQEPPQQPLDSRRLFLQVFPSTFLPIFLTIVDQTIVATALPAIAASLGGVERVSWVVVGYLISGTVMALAYGQLGDVLGRRRMLLIALMVYLAGATACVFSTSMEMLAAARLFQGLGGGGLMTLSQAMIGEVVPPRERGKFQGYFSAVGVVASTAGPVIGGLLTYAFGWRAVFVFPIPLALIAMVLILRMPAGKAEPVPLRFDGSGLFVVTAFTAAVVIALDQVQNHGGSRLALVIVLSVVAFAALLALLPIERRAAQPLLPPALMRQGAIWRCDLLAALHGGALVSLVTFLPIYLLAVHGMSTAQIGLSLVPLTAGISIGAFFLGHIITRTGHTAILCVVGLASATGLIGVLAVFGRGMAVWEITTLLLLLGMSMSSVMAIVNVTVQVVAGRARLGVASASVQFSRSMGASLGTSLVGAVLFFTLSATDPEASLLLGDIFRRGAAALELLQPERLAVLNAEIAGAFQAAFLTIACFTTIGVMLSATLPVRRI